MIWRNGRRQAIDSTLNTSTLDVALEEYTDDATSMEGSNVHRNEIVVRHDWSVGSTRVSSHLGSYGKLSLISIRSIQFTMELWTGNSCRMIPLCTSEF